MFIKIDDIKGESTEKAHLEWSDVAGFKFGVSSENSKSSPKPLIITKRLDRRSPLLFLHTAQGAPVELVTLELTRLTSNGKQVFYRIKLHGVTISSVTTDGQSGNDLPMEEVAFNFLKIEMQYTIVNEKGVTPTEPITWDFSSSTK